jgi:putative FmdB family regulatory protein
MPIYEYLCEKCGHEFEREQRITEDPVKVCPACRARKVRRLISRTAFVLKGSGWYSDLYASAKPGSQKKDAEGAGGGEAAGGEGKSESKGDSKSESKSEAKPAAAPSGKGKGKGKGKSARAA